MGFHDANPFVFRAEIAANPYSRTAPAFGTAPASAGNMDNSIADKNILIADDDERLLRALDKVLTSEGARVTPTKWAGDAVDVLMRQETKFDLVIADLQMPFVTGLTLLSSIHRIFPALPVIVLTAFGSPILEAECFREGATAFLEKPLDTAQLLGAVNAVFASSNANQQGMAICR